MLALGIDIGTSGVRSTVVEGDSLVAEASVPHRLQSAKHIDAVLWWHAVEDCLHRQVAALRGAGRDPKMIAAIAVDGTSGSMVLVDSALAPVGPALMYNSKGFDAEAARIASAVKGDHVAKGSNSALARAMHLVSKSEARPRHLLHQADFVVAQLLGRAGGSDHNNALKTGFDPQTGSWPDWIAEVIDPSLLPDVVAPGAELDEISTEVADRFGFSPQVRVHAGTTDSIAAFLAASPMEIGNAVTSLGSTLVVKLLSTQRIDDHAIGLYSHRLGDKWLVGGASNTGGAVLRAQFDDERLAELSAQIAPDIESRLDYYPLLAPGERFPINDPDLSPRMTPRPVDDVHYLHGLLESIARIEAACYREMQARGADFPSRIFTAGGGAQNAQWRTIRKRHLGVEPRIAENSDAAFGVAKLALMSAQD